MQPLLMRRYYSDPGECRILAAREMVECMA